MENHWFKLEVPKNILRQMNRKQYKAAMSWLRLCRRKLEEQIDFSQLTHKMTGWDCG